MVDTGMKFKRGKSCADDYYVDSVVGWPVGWLHVAAGGPLQGLDVVVAVVV